MAFCFGGERDETLLPSDSPSSRNYALLIGNDFGVTQEKCGGPHGFRLEPNCQLVSPTGPSSRVGLARGAADGGRQRANATTADKETVILPLADGSLQSEEALAAGVGKGHTHVPVFDCGALEQHKEGGRRPQRVEYRFA
jgi:hypothetical protein